MNWIKRNKYSFSLKCFNFSVGGHGIGYSGRIAYISSLITFFIELSREPDGIVIEHQTPNQEDRDWDLTTAVLRP